MWTDTAIAGAILDAIAQLTGRAAPTISATANLVNDLGIDSLAAAKLLAAIEDRLGKTLPEGSEGQLVGISTVGELVERITLVMKNPAAQSEPALR